MLRPRRGPRRANELERDPAEGRDLSADRPRPLAAALEAFETHRGALERPDQTAALALGEEERELLRSLGYL